MRAKYSSIFNLFHNEKDENMLFDANRSPQSFDEDMTGTGT